MKPIKLVDKKGFVKWMDFGHHPGFTIVIPVMTVNPLRTRYDPYPTADTISELRFHMYNETEECLEYREE